jgi:integrase
VKAAKQPARQGTVITAETRAKLVQAAQLVSQGVTHEEIGQRLRIGPHMIRYWQTAHPILWQLAVGTAMEVIRDMVRRLAGTKEVFTDPVGYLTAAYAAEKWSRGRNEPLFAQPVEGLTLTRFYYEKFVPKFVSGTSCAETAAGYEKAVRHWALTTGDPPLDQIDDDVLGTYRDLLVKCPGPSGKLLSPNSVRSRLVHIETLLRKAGPEGYRNRGAFGIIPRVPWCKKPRALYREPQVVPDRHIAAAYQAADLMGQPNVAGIPPGDWWRAWLVVAFNTGLRVGSLVNLEWAHVRCQEGLIVMPPECFKTGRGLTLPLLPIVAEHLEQIRGERRLVFAWTQSKEQLRNLLHELQDKAGIPRAEHFGMHRVRKTTATKLYAINPKAAQLVLGHTTMDMTTMHYVNGAQTMGPAMRALSQPFGRQGDQP